MYRNLLISLLLAIALTTSTFAQDAGNGISVGAVYAMTNSISGNAIVVYDRSADGTLTMNGSFSTKGLGGFAGEPADALGSEGALILSHDKHWLYAANAGSDNISVFRVTARGLTLVQRISSGGNFPVSLTLYQDLLYVLNSGGNGNITGFTVTPSGRLKPIPGSTRSLNAGGGNPPNFIESPAQVGFDPSGRWLVVTIKSLNQIDLFAVDDNGQPAADPVLNESNGSTPFGFGFDASGHLIVAEPFGPATEIPAGNAGAVSSYSIGNDGFLSLISATVENQQTATCWIVLGPRNRFVYATNNVSNTITGYHLGRNGTLKLLNPNTGVTAESDTRPVDMGVTADGHYLYSLNAGSGTVAAYRINSRTGALSFLGKFDGLPKEDGAAGLAVR